MCKTGENNLIIFITLKMSDIVNVKQTKIEDEEDKNIVRNTILYPILKSFLEEYPQYYDTINTFESTIEAIKNIIEKDNVIDVRYNIPDSNKYVHFKLHMENTNIYDSDSPEMQTHSNLNFNPTPNHALMNSTAYTCLMMSDVVYSIDVCNKQGTYEEILFNDSKPLLHFDDVLKGKYIVNIPIPIGCKWCALTKYPQSILDRIGEDLKCISGFYVIDGVLRYLLPIYKKPFNKPVIVKNDYDEQLSRCEAIYTKGYEYENSYYMVGAMVIKKNLKARGGSVKASCDPDFGFSLQFHHPSMISETNFGSSKSHKLYNFIPIRILFGAFGCVDDYSLISYINPKLDNFGLINTISRACTRGYKHFEALKNANIKLKPNNEYIVFDEHFTEFLCKYIIGMNILKPDYIKELMEKGGTDENFRMLVVNTVTEIFNERFMPDIGNREHGSKVDRNTAICMELANLVRELYFIGSNLQVPQDKASLVNKRIRSSQQLSQEFKAFHGVRLREISLEIEKCVTKDIDLKNLQTQVSGKLNNIMGSISRQQTYSLIKAFKGISKEQSKIRTEVLKPNSQLWAWNKQRELIIANESKLNAAPVTWENRTVHPSDLFFICFLQTPDSGETCGKYRTPTITTRLTIDTSIDKILKLLNKDTNIQPRITDENRNKNLYSIRVNGNIIGFIDEYEPVDKLYERIIEARRTGEIECDISCSVNHYQSKVDIWTDNGRIVGVFVVVKNCFDIADYVVKPKPEFVEWLSIITSTTHKFNEGIKKGFIEYLCPDMCINNCIIAPSIVQFYENPNLYTHIALPHGSTGIVMSMSDGCNLNLGLRSSYASNHIRQSLGNIMKYPMMKYLPEINVLLSQQVPITRPIAYDYLHMNETPIGTNVIVCFMSDKDNQEDALIISREAVETGLLKLNSISTITNIIDKVNEKYGIPPSNITHSGNVSSYDKLDEGTALPKNISTEFYTNDALIAKTITYENGLFDSSILNEKPDGTFNKTATNRPVFYMLHNTKFDKDNVKKSIVLGQYRPLINGDKTTFFHAQKNTVSIRDTEDMPILSNGLRPHVIFNPPAILKRNTYGMIYQATLSKIATLLGCTIDSTPYHTVRNCEQLTTMLRKLGLNEDGKETLYDPSTGRPKRAKIFVGMSYLSRQPHLVEQKLSVRCGGPRVLETGLPTHGRKRNGGCSSDRMSFSSHVAAGFTETHLDNHLNSGAKITVAYCKKCHSTNGYINANTGEAVCPKCGVHKDMIIKTVIPGSVLINHILNGCHVGMKYYENLDDVDITEL